MQCLVTQNPELMAEKSDLFQESTATNNGYYSTIEHNNKLACKVSKHHIHVINSCFTCFYSFNRMLFLNMKLLPTRMSKDLMTYHFIQRTLQGKVIRDFHAMIMKLRQISLCMKLQCNFTIRLQEHPLPIMNQYHRSIVK